MAKTTQLASAALPLTGAELLPIVQAGQSRKVTAQSLAALGRDKGDPGGDASQVGTRLQAETMNFAAGIDMIRTTGFATRGDGGAANYLRWQAPMVALTAPQEGISWFEAPDASRWVLAPHQQWLAAMFGAVGGEADVADIINLALLAPMTQNCQFGLGNLTHRISKAINRQNGQVLYGNINLKSSVLSFIPLPVGTQGAENGQPSALIAITGTLANPITSGAVFGIVLEGNRAGLNTGVGNDPFGSPWESKNRVSGLRMGGYVSGQRVYSMLSRNITGYSMYNGASGAELQRDNWYCDVLTINGQTAFEATGRDMETRYTLCRSLSAPDDGGPPVVYDHQFHFYGGVKSIIIEMCSADGPAPAMVVAVTDAYANRGIEVRNSDFKSSSATPAVYISNEQAGSILRNEVSIVDTKITSTSTVGLHVGNSDVLVKGGVVTGETVGTFANTGGVITLAGGAKSIGRVDKVANTAQAAQAILRDGVGATIIKRGPLTLEAYHAFGGARNTNEHLLTTGDDLILVPPVVGGPANLPPPLRRQQLHQVRVLGNTLENHFYQDSATQYRASILLPLEPLDWDKVKSHYEMRPPFGNTDFSGTITIVGNGRLDVSPNEVYVRISTTAALPVGYKLHIELWENV